MEAGRRLLSGIEQDSIGEAGATLIEYLFVVTIIAVGAIGAMQMVGCQLSNTINSIGNAVTNAV